MIKKILAVVLLSSVLILNFSGCSEKSKIESTRKFSTNSNDKVFHINGDYTSTNLTRNKKLEVNAHLKNMTNDKYNLSSEGNIIKIHFEKIGNKIAYAETGEVRTIEANDVISIKENFIPKENGEYILSIKSEFSAYNQSSKQLNQYNIILLDTHISVK